MAARKTTAPITVVSVTMRRLASLLTATLLLRLNFVAVDWTCAAHEVAPSAHTTGDAAHHDNAHRSANLAPTESSEECDAPARADCCDAFVSCSLAFGLTVDSAQEGLGSTREAVLALGIDRPTSIGNPPDPPPPRA